MKKLVAIRASMVREAGDAVEKEPSVNLSSPTEHWFLPPYRLKQIAHLVRDPAIQ
jgi:hypothetical protein